MNASADSVRKTLLALGCREEDVNAAVVLLAGSSEGAAANANEPLLCQKEVCAELKISHTTLWRIDPPSYKVGGRKRYKLSEVLAHMQTQGYSPAEQG